MWNREVIRPRENREVYTDREMPIIREIALDWEIVIIREVRKIRAIVKIGKR